MSRESGVGSRESGVEQPNAIFNSRIQIFLKSKISPIKKMLMGNYNDLFIYKKAFGLAMKIFELSKSFPVEEKFAITNQIRRSSRSVCANLAESYQRRKYKNHFLSKLNDVESENAETQVWLDFSFNCAYISAEKYEELTNENNEIGKLTWFMINNPEKFL